MSDNPYEPPKGTSPEGGESLGDAPTSPLGYFAWLASPPMVAGLTVYCSQFGLLVLVALPVGLLASIVLACVASRHCATTAIGALLVLFAEGLACLAAWGLTTAIFVPDR